MRTTRTAIKEAVKELEKHLRDDETYHGTFDEILEKRLMELDPTFMKKLSKMYDESGLARWCA